MAQLPSPPPRPRLPQRPRPRAGRSNAGRVWHVNVPSPIIIPHPLGPFPLPGPVPGYGWMNPPPLPPFGPSPRPGFSGDRPSGFGYPYVPPAQPQSQVNVMNVNEFVENLSKVDSQTSAFAILRRGTGVFIPVPIPPCGCNRPGRNNRGTERRQNEGIWRSTTRNDSKENDGSVKQEECPQTPTSEIGLPKEWTY